MGGGAEPPLGIGMQEDTEVLRKGVLLSPPMSMHVAVGGQTRRMEAEGAGRGLSLSDSVSPAPLPRRDQLGTWRADTDSWGARGMVVRSLGGGVTSWQIRHGPSGSMR